MLRLGVYYAKLLKLHKAVWVRNSADQFHRGDVVPGTAAAKRSDSIIGLTGWQLRNWSRRLISKSSTGQR